MPDMRIQDLDEIESLKSGDLIPVSDSGDGYNAKKVTGEQIAQFAKESADANVQAALAAANRAEAAAQITAHPPQANLETGFWQTWNSELNAYVDTTLRAEGPIGPPGESITDIKRTSGTGAAGTVDTYAITTSTGREYQFQVYNGADGLGAGDMLKSVYDPQGISADIYAYFDSGVQAAQQYTDESVNNAATALKEYTDSLVGSISGTLDSINGEVI